MFPLIFHQHLTSMDVFLLTVVSKGQMIVMHTPMPDQTISVNNILKTREKTNTTIQQIITL
jgi:hypothetical protein